MYYLYDKTLGLKQQFAFYSKRVVYVDLASFSQPLVKALQIS